MGTGGGGGSGGHNEEKWTSSSLHDFRVSMAEVVIRPGLEHLLSFLRSQPVGSLSVNSSVQHVQHAGNSKIQGALLVRDKLQNMAQVWQQLNCFDSVTLVDELKRLILKIVNEEGSDSSGANNDDETTSSPSTIAASTGVDVDTAMPPSSALEKSDSIIATKSDAPTQQDEAPTVENETMDFEMGNDDDNDDDENNADDNNNDQSATMDNIASAESSSAVAAVVVSTAASQDDEEITAAPSSDNEKGSLDVSMSMSMEENMDGEGHDRGLKSADSTTTTETSPSKAENKEKEKEKVIVKEFDFESEVRSCVCCAHDLFDWYN